MLRATIASFSLIALVSFGDPEPKSEFFTKEDIASFKASLVKNNFTCEYDREGDKKLDKQGTVRAVRLSNKSVCGEDAAQKNDVYQVIASIKCSAPGMVPVQVTAICNPITADGRYLLQPAIECITEHAEGRQVAKKGTKSDAMLWDIATPAQFDDFKKGKTGAEQHGGLMTIPAKKSMAE